MTKENKPFIQIDDLVREMTDEEYQETLLQQQQSDKLLKQNEEKVLSRQSALAKLAKLGLTEKEIASL